MEPYRIANFICQIVYLVLHLCFIIKIIKTNRTTKVFRWFLACAVCMWLWVSGRFLESVVYIFMPGNNGAYVFAANYQYIGMTTTIGAYVLWSLYYAGLDRAADSALVRASVFALPILCNALVFTNEYHHLFYTKLIMGQSVEHGPVFLPLALAALVMVGAGCVISYAGIIRKGEQVARKLLLFSAVPALPVLVSVIRSVSHIDRFDYTPVVMTAVTGILYLLSFRYNDLGFVTASINDVIRQSAHPVGIFDPCKGFYVYQNAVAEDRYAEDFARIVSCLPSENPFQKGPLRVITAPLEDGRILVTATDLGELTAEAEKLERINAELQQIRTELEEENRNIDAYLESLLHTEGLESKRALIDGLYEEIGALFIDLRNDLVIAKDAPADTAAHVLQQSMGRAEDCMVKIRAAVARLKEV